MSVKLRVTNERDDGGTPSEYLFEQDRITIGRGSQNDLTLNDPKRIVSTEHAEVRHEGGTHQLIDRGSKNFTYLRNQRLEGGEPYELRDGDVFTVGDFKIEFASVQPQDSAPAYGETVFAADFSNPFSDPAEDLVQALNEIVDAYEQESAQRREDALKDAFREADADLGAHEAVHRAMELLGMEASGGQKSAESAPSTTKPSQASGPGSSRTESTRGTADQRRDAPFRADPSRSASGVQAEDEVVDDVLDVLLESFSRIVGIPWQFRHEFIGQTIMQLAETEFIYDGDAATMKEHLLDPSLSQEEREKRLDHVKDAAESLAVHQVAMLNGYKASVMNGAEELMEQLDPDAHQAEVAEDNVVFEYVPMLASPVVLDRLQAQWEELQRGDWSAAEQRIFRPAFIKAYLARMTAQPSDEN